MFPYAFEAVTAITLTVLSIIIIIYIVVLKKKGWLKEETSPESFFLCPNPECQKTFQKPTKLTDLSETPSRERSACPHCGVILTASPSKIQKKPKLAVEKPKPVTSIEPTRVKEDSAEVMETPKPLENPHEYKALEHLKTKTLPTEQAKASEISKEEELPTTPSKNTEARPQECAHYFGYLKTAPKNAAMPDECFSCPKMMECFYSKD